MQVLQKSPELRLPDLIHPPADVKAENRFAQIAFAGLKHLREGLVCRELDDPLIARKELQLIQQEGKALKLGGEAAAVRYGKQVASPLKRINGLMRYDLGRHGSQLLGKRPKAGGADEPFDLPAGRRLACFRGFFFRFFDGLGILKSFHHLDGLFHNGLLNAGFLNRGLQPLFDLPLVFCIDHDGAFCKAFPLNGAVSKCLTKLFQELFHGKDRVGTVCEYPSVVQLHIDPPRGRRDHSHPFLRSQALFRQRITGFVFQNNNFPLGNVIGGLNIQSVLQSAG